MKQITKYLFLLALAPAFSDVYHVFSQPQQPEIIYVQPPQISYQPEYRTIRNIGASGSLIELDDTSQWIISPECQRFIATWQIGDVVTFSPSRRWNKGKFYFTNNRTNGIAYASASLSPFLDQPNTFKIIHLDPTRKFVTIRSNAGVQFQYKLSTDKHDWEVGETISVGLDNPHNNCCGNRQHHYLYSWESEEGHAAQQY